MFRSLSATGCAAAIASLILPAAPALAQVGVPSPIFVIVLKAGEFGSQNYTKVLTGKLASAQSFCGAIADKGYVVDCLAERFGAISSDIPAGTDYAEVQQILKDTSDKLARLAQSNRNSAAPRARLSTPGATPTTTSRPLTAVDPARAQSVNQQAAAILDDTTTLLLRSGRTPDSKLAQYQRIADAIGSNKVLLRSA